MLLCKKERHMRPTGDQGCFISPDLRVKGLLIIYSAFYEIYSNKATSQGRDVEWISRSTLYETVYESYAVMLWTEEINQVNVILSREVTPWGKHKYDKQMRRRLGETNKSFWLSKLYLQMWYNYEHIQYGLMSVLFCVFDFVWFLFPISIKTNHTFNSYEVQRSCTQLYQWNVSSFGFVAPDRFCICEFISCILASRLQAKVKLHSTASRLSDFASLNKNVYRNVQEDDNVIQEVHTVHTGSFGQLHAHSWIKDTHWLLVLHWLVNIESMAANYTEKCLFQCWIHLLTLKNSTKQKTLTEKREAKLYGTAPVWRWTRNLRVNCSIFRK